MPSPKQTYLGKLSGGATKPPIPWDRINFTSMGATAPATPPAPAPVSDPKSQYISSYAAATPSTSYDYVGGKAIPQGTAGTTNTSTTSSTDAAFEDYLKSLQASPEHKAAQDYLNGLITQSQQANEKALNTGETLGFATGEAARVGRQNNLAIDAASRALGVYETADKNRADIGKVRLDYEQSKVKAAAAAAVAEQNSKPASAKEYEYAQKQGYKGTYSQYQNEDANRKAKAAGATQTQSNAAQADDVAQAILDFQNKIQTNGWAGANPQAYDYYRQELTKLYGASAALALDAAMKTAGIVVDRKNK